MSGSSRILFDLFVFGQFLIAFYKFLMVSSPVSDFFLFRINYYSF